MAKITLTNIAEELAVKSGLSKEAAEKFVRAFVATLEEGLHADNITKVKGLGTFKLLQVSDRDSVDVSTGERITIKGYTKVSFTPDSAMKEFVNRPFAHFEPTELNEGYPTDEDMALPDSTVDAGEENDVAESMDAAVENPNVETAAEEVVEEVAAESVETVETAEAVVPEETTEVVDSAVDEAVEVDNSLETMPVAAVEAVSAEEKVKVETVSAADETVEASHATEEVVEEAPVVEESADVHPETAEEVAPATEEVETISENSDKKSAACPKRKKRRGCGCVVGTLLVLFAVIAVVGGYFTFDNIWMGTVDEVKGHGDIVVKTNLEEELGAEWGDDAKVEEPKPVEKQSDEATLLAPKDTVAEKQEEPRVVVAEKAKPVAVAEVAKSATENPFCAVVITASLQEKTIKDITPADTTDYIMGETLVTHTLKSGETIIALAKKYYGDKRLWPYIVKYNKMKNFNSVAIGQKIKVPVLKEKTIE